MKVVLPVALVIETPELAEAARKTLRELPVRIVLEQTSFQDWGGLLHALERSRPEVVLLDVTRLPKQLEGALREVRQAAPHAMIIAVHTLAHPEAILAAMRAGAHEYLYPPLADGLLKAIDRRTQERRPENQGSVLAFLSAKGGCGATTVACHVALELGRLSADQKGMALLADLDMEAGMVGFLMKSKSPYSVLDAVDNLHRLDLSYWQALVSNGWQGLEVVTGPSDLVPKPAPTSDSVREIIRFARSQYRWTVLDLGRSLSVMTVGALEESEACYLVATPEVPALHQARQIVATLINSGFGKDRLRLVLNRKSPQLEVTAAELEKILGLPIYCMLPNDYRSLYVCYSEGSMLNNSCELGRELERMARRVAGVPAPVKKKRLGLW